MVDRSMSYDLEAYQHVDEYLKLKHRSNQKTPLEIQVEGILKGKSLEYHHSRACLHRDMLGLMICIWYHMTIDELKFLNSNFNDVMELNTYIHCSTYGVSGAEILYDFVYKLLLIKVRILEHTMCKTDTEEYYIVEYATYIRE